MTAAQLLAILDRLGAQIDADGDGLAVDGPRWRLAKQLRIP